MKNPYIPLDVDEASLAQEGQKRLTGDGIRERQLIIFQRGELKPSEKRYSKSGVLPENEKIYYKALCKDIIKERKRIGGNWVIADASLQLKGVRQFVR